MPHVRERQPDPDEPSAPQPAPTGPATADVLAEDHEPARTPGRVDAGEAVTGRRAGSAGEAQPGGIPGDDSSLEGGDPV